MTQIGPFPATSSSEIITGLGGTAWTSPTTAWNLAGVAGTIQNYGDDPPNNTLGINFGGVGTLPVGAVVHTLQFTAKVKRNLVDPTFTLESSTGVSPSTNLPCTIGGTFDEAPDVDGFEVCTIDVAVSAAQSAAIFTAWNAGRLRLGVHVSDPDGHPSGEDHIEVHGATMVFTDYTTPIQSYERTKATLVNATPIAMRPYVTETPAALTTGNGALTAGTTAKASLLWQADADESGGADVQDIIKIVVTPSINADGFLVYTVDVTFVNGDLTETTQSFTFTHPQSMDAWQTAAGRARQA